MKGWTFRRKMILAYATISFLVSIGLGYVVYQTSSAYERESVREALKVSSRSYVTQMEDRLSRMDAIISYLVSDASLLENITILSKEAEGITIPPFYVREAREELRIGISSDYIMENSYRTVFANESYFASSAVKMFKDSDERTRRLRDHFSLGEISYLEEAKAAEGKTVLIGPHEDYWGVVPDVWVYSVAKQLRGTGMGFIEVENRLDSLSTLGGADPEMGYFLFLPDGELLYGSQEEEAKRLLGYIEGHLGGEEEVWTQGGYFFAASTSSLFGLQAVSYKPGASFLLTKGRVFETSFLSSLVAFALSLAVIILWSHLLTRPIHRLREVMERTNIENLVESGKVPLEAAGMDEFASLSSAYEAMTRRLNVALENERRSERLQIQAQFDVLQTQVNPHFIYNVLNIISARAVMADDEVICEMCGSLGNLLRYSTNNKERYATISEEIEYLHNYFYLLECRYETRLKVSMEIPEEVRRQTIPKMTLQQVVENCVKHGFHDTGVDMEISIAGQMLEDGWRIWIRDNGCGISEERLKEVRKKLSDIEEQYHEGSVPTEAEIGGMGLASAYARCLLLYNSSFVFEIGNAPEGTGTQVTLGVRGKKE